MDVDWARPMNRKQPASVAKTTSEVIQFSNQKQQISHSVDHWNAGMLFSLVLTVVAAAAVLATTRMITVRSKQLAGIQDELQAAKDVQATADRLQLERTLSEQQERTAAAEKALFEVQQEVRGREITTEQVERLRSIAKGVGQGVVLIQKQDDDPEAVEYARQIFNALNIAGWKPAYTPGRVIGGMQIGLTIQGEASCSQVLKNCFERVGIRVDNYAVRSEPSVSCDSVFVAIGHKP